MLQSLRRTLSRSAFPFGSQKAHTHPSALQDWEYCKHISQSLKNRDIDGSLSFLFQVSPS